jgi:hypothetical protein
MGFNRRKMEDQRREAAEKEAAARRATDAQVLEDAERLIAAWNERQALRAPMIFSPTIGGRHQGGLLVPVGTLSSLRDNQRDRPADAGSSPRCRGDKPHSFALVPFMPASAPFAELVRLSRTSIADEMREEHRRQVFWG